MIQVLRSRKPEWAVLNQSKKQQVSRDTRLHLLFFRCGQHTCKRGRATSIMEFLG